MILFFNDANLALDFQIVVETWWS